jgi:hypothetical protein
MTSLQAALTRFASRKLAIAPRALETLLAAGRVALVPQYGPATRGRGYAVSPSSTPT